MRSSGIRVNSKIQTSAKSTLSPPEVVKKSEMSAFKSWPTTAKPESEIPQSIWLPQTSPAPIPSFHPQNGLLHIQNSDAKASPPADPFLPGNSKPVPHWALIKPLQPASTTPSTNYPNWPRTFAAPASAQPKASLFYTTETLKSMDQTADRQDERHSRKTVAVPTPAVDGHLDVWARHRAHYAHESPATKSVTDIGKCGSESGKNGSSSGKVREREIFISDDLIDVEIQVDDKEVEMTITTKSRRVNPMWERVINARNDFSSRKNLFFWKPKHEKSPRGEEEQSVPRILANL